MTGRLAPGLAIDTARARSEIVEYLQSVTAREQTDGLALGLSGGVDSAVLAALAVAAAGPDAVRAAYIYDHDSDPRIGQLAADVASQLGLRFSTHDMSSDPAARPKMPALGRFLGQFAGVNKAGSAMHRRVWHESVFKTTLSVGAGESLKPRLKQVLFNRLLRPKEEGFNLRHRYRRTLLETTAREANLTLIGGANRSEVEIGWFVKDGVDDLDIQPLAGLFKTQVWQLAESLGLPNEVWQQKASPDMAPGVTDEASFGHSYATVDTVLDGLDQGLSREQFRSLGVTRRELEDIQDLMRLSAWKRSSGGEKPPVSGAFGSPLRLRQ